MARLIAALAVVAGLIAAAPAAIAGDSLVVIDAAEAGADLQPGRVLALTDTVELKEGGRLSLLNEEGRLVLVKGPFSGVLASVVAAPANAPGDGDTVMTKIAGLLEGKDSIVSFGAARAVGEVPDEVPHPAFISVMAPGERCLVSPEPNLWRADAGEAVTVTLTGPGGRSQTLDWPAGVDRLKLPAQFIVDGADLEVAQAGASLKLKLNLPPAGVVNLSQILAWLGERQCRGQAVALLKALREEARAAP